jgi:hypothetical protein
MKRLGRGYYAAREISVLPSQNMSWGILHEKIQYPFQNINLVILTLFCLAIL